MNKKNKGTKKPFFANFLEHQVSGDQKENAQGGITLKYPSDQEEDGNGGLCLLLPNLSWTMMVVGMLP